MTNLAVFLAVLTLLIGWRRIIIVRRRSFRRAAVERLAGLINEKIGPLTIQKRKLIGSDAYGNIIRRRWEKEAKYFFDSNIRPCMADPQLKVFHTSTPEECATLLDTVMNSLIDGADHNAPSYQGDDPQDYERFCAELLRSAGWQARTTSASNDQGADVIADRSGLRLVLQCKLYRHPVGNKAVQEVSAARMHESATAAAVVTNSRFTPQAQALARTNGVALLHHDELRSFAAQLSERARIPSGA